MIGNSIPPLSRYPKPRSKGKKPKPKKLKPAPTIDPIDVFKTAMHADAGADSSHDPNSLLYDLINQLSGPQLKKLDVLIQKVQTRVLHSLEEQLLLAEACKRISAATLERRQRSRAEKASLMLTLQESLGTLKLSDIEYSSDGKIQALRVERKKMSLQTFMKQYLSDELSLVGSLMDSGTLLPDGKRQNPQSFLESMLRAYFTSI